MHMNHTDSNIVTYSDLVSTNQRYIEAEQWKIVTPAHIGSGSPLRGQLLQEALEAAGFRNVQHYGNGIVTIPEADQAHVWWWLDRNRMGSFGFEWQMIGGAFQFAV